MGKKTILGISAILSGIFASICCLGPIILALFGLSFAGFAQFHKYRPIFIIVSLVFLGFAFYSVYRKREIKCSDGTCRIESSNKTTKIILWIITAIVLGAISFLWWYPVLAAKLETANTTINASSQLGCAPTTKGTSGNYDIVGGCR